MKKQIVIIGAGPSGLAQLRAFKQYQDKCTNDDGNSNNIEFDVICYEKQSNWGGLWNYTWRTGTDEYGELVHCSMYRYLWSNGPKEGLEFADYTFDEHFKGQSIGSYPPRAVLYDYINGRAEKSNIRDNIKFEHIVRRVEYNNDINKFRVVVEDLKTCTEIELVSVDHVIVANGHFSTPNVPEFEGFNTFNGRILHSHDFRDACEFKNQNILIIGTSKSAEDIGSQCWKYGCNSVTISHRTKPIGFDWPSNFKEVPLLDKIDKDGKTAIFIDGTIISNIDSIILCTGYKHHFPFLESKLRLSNPINRLAINDLYKGVVYIKNTNLFYLGMQDQSYTFNMFDAQAWYVRDCILGIIRKSIPTTLEERQQDVMKRINDEDSMINPYKDVSRYQANYIKELLSELNNTTDYPIFDLNKSNEVFFQWKQHKKENIMGFRDNVYTSPITNKVASLHHTPWIKAMDDSIESYLQQK